MNILGLTVNRTSSIVAAAPVPAIDADGKPITQARLFKDSWAANMAREGLDDIRTNAGFAKVITKLVMAITMPHQIGYLLGIAPLDFRGSVQMIAASVTMLMMAFGGPVAADMLTLMYMRNVASKVLMTKARVWSAVLMLIPVGASGYVNFIAPAPPVLKLMAAFLVSLIPISIIGRALSQMVDLAKMDRTERKMVDQIPNEEPTTARRLSDTEKERRRQVRLFNDYHQRWTDEQRRAWHRDHGRAVPKMPTEKSVEDALASKVVMPNTPQDLLDQQDAIAPTSAAPATR